MSETPRDEELRATIDSAAQAMPQAPVRWGRVRAVARRKLAFHMLGVATVAAVVAVLVVFGGLVGKVKLDSSYRPPIAVPLVTVSVPEVVSLRTQKAVRTIKAADLKVTRSGPCGGSRCLVRAQEPAPGANVARGAKVTLVLAAPVEIPRVVGIRVEDAMGTLERARLDARVVSPCEPPGLCRVQRQVPAPGTLVLPGSRVTITAERLERKLVPKLINLSPDAAKSRLKAAGLEATAKGPCPANGECGVVHQDPAAGLRIPEDERVTITLGRVGKEPPGERAAKVPNVVGLAYGAAYRALNEVRLQIRPRAPARCRIASSRCRVVSQSPTAGTRVRLPRRVTVALGEVVAVPDVEGMAAETAEAELSDAGLEVGREGECPADATLCGVTDQRPEHGGRVPARTMVTITLGAVEGVTVPDVGGLDEEAAKEKLKAAGLLVRTDGACPSDGLCGVVAQDEDPRARVPRRQTVTIMLGEVVEVPPVEGMAVAQAEQALEKVSLKHKRSGRCQTECVVKSQDPRAGKRVKPDTRVTLTLEAKS